MRTSDKKEQTMRIIKKNKNAFQEDAYRSLIDRISVSCCIPCMPPPPEQPHMPPKQPGMPPRATMHAPPREQPRMPSPGVPMHAPSEQPCTPPWEQPCMPPPGATMHLPLPEQPCTPPQEQPHMPPPGATTHAPPCGQNVDTRFWKYYLAPTSLRAVTMKAKQLLYWSAFDLYYTLNRKCTLHFIIELNQNII